MHSASLDLDDYVGVESYVDLKSDMTFEPYKWFSNGGDGGGLKRQKKKKEKTQKEYPPPIPGLARTENIPSSQMPWVMKRYHTSDGRLIIKEEKVKRYEYFEAHRTNGRLVLNLVPLNDDDNDDDDKVVDNCCEVQKEEGCDDHRDLVTDGCHQENIDDMIMDDEPALVNGGSTVVIGGGSGGGSKCSSLCNFGMAVPAIRPVHT